jgi:hypothetical protein
MLIPVVLLSGRASEETSLLPRRLPAMGEDWDGPRRVLYGSSNRGAHTNDGGGRAFHYLSGSRVQPANVELILALDHEIGTVDKAALTQLIEEVANHQVTWRAESEDGDTIWPPGSLRPSRRVCEQGRRASDKDRAA